MVWKLIAVLFDFVVSRLHISSFERRFSYYQSVNNNSQGPNVNLVRVTIFTFKHLGCYIIGSSANSPFSFTIEIKLRRKSKVSQFEIHLVANHQVSKLEVSVDYSIFMKIFKYRNDLLSVIHHLKFV